MDKHVAVVIFDTGSGRTTGFFLNGRRELDKPVLDALRPVAGLGEFQNMPDALDGTDNFDFALSGVPNLVATQDATPYLPDYHAETDVFDRVNQREARSNEAIAAATRVGPRRESGAPGEAAVARRSRAAPEEHQARRANESFRAVG